MVLAEGDVKGDRAETISAAFGGAYPRLRPLRIAVVGSSALTSIPYVLYEFLMDALPDPTTILLRRGNKSPVGSFERLVQEVIKQSSHLNLRWILPDPDGGPGAAFNRDNEMVGMADLVLAFFEPGHIMSGGTGHVVETAIDRAVPVYSFAMDDTALTRVGDHDPDALWQQLIGESFTE